jgi:NAD(P)H-dependent FMN reductase
MYNLKIIIGSTRAGRKGPAVAAWVNEFTKKYSEFNSELIDLAEVNLPLLDEPNHPSMKQYQNEHTKRWSAIVDSADAYILVTPEYNFSMPASVKNALDYVYQEWNYKPMAFVSYGGISGGMRSTQMIKEVVTTLKMVPVMEAVTITFFNKYIDDQNRFTANETLEKSADTMIKALLKWTKALKPMRESTGKS